jgi:alpha-L-fucosidase
VRAAGKNANLLLNVGPMANGEIPEQAASRLREVGQWLAKNGEAIYGTRGGPFAPQTWGVSTQKQNKVYVHVLDAPGPSLALTKPARVIRAAYLLKDHSAVQFAENDFGLLLRLPQRAADEVDQIIVLETR